MFETRRLRGYTDLPSYRSGDEIEFRISSDVESYDAVLVRLIAGDPNPDGPGHKEEEIQIAGKHRGRRQETHTGSYVEVAASPDLALVGGFTIHAFVQPTMAGRKPQAIISKWCCESEVGWILDIAEDGCLRIRTSGDGGTVSSLSLTKPMFDHVWYSVAATFNPASGSLELRQRSVVNGFNSRFGPVVPLDSDDTRSLANAVAPGDAGGPMVIAGAPRSAKPKRLWVEQCFNGKIDSPSIRSTALGQEDRSRF
jgi:N,N-dimethylformamidase